jgi:glycosyltransferase involved in cell wall biosynthesis
VKILWASPLPPVRSGVSDYAVELLHELHQVARLRIVAPPAWQRPDDWPFGNELPVIDSEAEPDADELQLVHIGNNPYHEWLLPRLAGPRTVAVMHDLVVHHLLVESTLTSGHPEEYLESLRRAHPDAATALVRARGVGVTGHRDPFLFPARGSVLTEVIGAVVHSHWAHRLLVSEFPGLPVRRVSLAVADPGSPDRQGLRADLGIDSETVLLMHLGYLTPEKGLATVLTALAAARQIGIACHLVLVGEGAEQSKLDAVVGELGHSDMVSFTGWVPGERLCRLPAAADLGLVLRTPSAGETSAAALRFLACGTPVAVNGLNQFLEWPAEAAPRITPGPSAAADLTRLIVEACDAANGWPDRRRAARAVYAAGHRPQQVARELVTALEEIWAQEPVRHRPRDEPLF